MGLFSGSIANTCMSRQRIPGNMTHECTYCIEVKDGHTHKGTHTHTHNFANAYILTCTHVGMTYTL